MLALDSLEHLLVVDQLPPLGGVGGEYVGDELVRVAGQPLRQRHRESHLVRAVEDLLRDGLARGPLEDVLHVAVLELDVGGHGRGQLDQPVVEEGEIVGLISIVPTRVRLVFVPVASSIGLGMRIAADDACGGIAVDDLITGKRGRRLR